MVGHMAGLAVKYCGFTDIAQIQTAASLGVDAVGLVFYPPSPRAVSVDQGATLAAAVPAFVTVVALVVNMDEAMLGQLAEQVRFDVIQFHGDESADECAALANGVHKRWIKALRIQADPKLTQQENQQAVVRQIEAYATAGASSILLDAYHKDKFGGTGERFDWSIIPEDSPLPVILAGGLTPENVAATAELPIYAVDVSGGIEKSSAQNDKSQDDPQQHKGQKDGAKMRAFMKAVKRDRWQD